MILDLDEFIRDMGAMTGGIGKLCGSVFLGFFVSSSIALINSSFPALADLTVILGFAILFRAVSRYRSIPVYPASWVQKLRRAFDPRTSRTSYETSRAERKRARRQFRRWFVAILLGYVHLMAMSITISIARWYPVVVDWL